MYATVRRYEGIDKLRSGEVTRKVGDSLLPTLRELPGFGGYYLIDAGGGVLTSVGFFETSARAHESTRAFSSSPQRPSLVSDKRGFSQGGFHESAAA